AEVPGSLMRPYGIIVDSNDRPWFACLGSNVIGTVDPADMKIELKHTPDERSRIRRIGVDSRDRIWWTDAARGFLGVYDPESDSMEQWQSPGGERSALYAMAVDSNDRIWFAETGLFPNRIVGFDPAEKQFI